MIGSIILFGLLFMLSNSKLEELPIHLEKQYVEIAKARSDEIGKELKGLTRPVELLSKDPIIRSMDLDKIKEFLPEVVLYENYRNMTIAYPNGSAWSTELQGFDISLQEQYREIFSNNKEEHISQPFKSQYIGAKDNPVITIAHSVKDDKNQTIGLVNGVVKIKFLNEILKNIELSEKGYSWIVNRNGTLVTHSDIDGVFGKNIKDYNLEKNKGINRILEDKVNIIEYENKPGREIIAFSSPIVNSPGWIFVISMDKQELFKGINSIRNTILASIAIGVLFLIIFSFYYSNKLTKPILNLKDTFEEASNGNLNARADESSQNELGQAAKSFNKMLDQIKNLTYNDIITGVYNYNGFLIELKYILNGSKKNKKMGAIIIISIDDFKSINSLHGFDLGDQVLRKFSQSLKRFTKEGEVMGRFLGDEFIVFIQEDSESILKGRINSIWKLCNGEVNLEDVKFIVRTSTGVSISNINEISIEKLIHQATVAKLKVKKNGGNDIAFYDSKMEADILMEQKIEESLYGAIEKDELHLVYQPIIDSITGEVVLMEALLRWDSPIHGSISPVKIVEIAERNGFIIDIGNWVMREACTKNKELQDKGYKPIRVAVNVSAIQFQQANFPDIVREILDETGMEGKYLEIEITETNIMDIVEEKIKTMEKLKAMGISISIDDFGTGYSSLSYLTRFPIDILKIDKSFIQDMLNDKNSKTIVSTIIIMAKSIKLSIVAEGVETIEQFNYLQSEGCHKIQGYLISKPTEIIKIQEMLKLESS